MNRILLFCLLLIYLFSCSEKKSFFEHQGGTIRMCLEHEPINYKTSEIADYYSTTVFSQVMEGLVGIDPKTLKVKNQIASSWKINDDGTSYSFTIRDDIYFHPNKIFSNSKDRILKHEDIIASFEMMCTPSSKGKASVAYNHLLKDLIVGAEDYFEKKSKTITGITSENGKLIIKLLHRDDNFLFKLSQIQLSIHSKKIIEANLLKEMVGTGPFIYNAIDKYDDMPAFLLGKNEEYYETDEQGNALPYLDSIHFYIQNSQIAQLDLFEKKEIDFILSLPTSKITKMVEGRLSDFNSSPPKLILTKNALLQTHYYFFNMNEERFKDPKVRQAFNYAINREKIGRDILKNQFDELGFYGITPPINKIFKGYNFDEIKKFGYEYNPEKAKKLLKEAGYPNGEGFGSVNLRYHIGDVNSAVANEFAQQIYQVLGININMDGSDYDQFTTDAINGNGDLFKSSWIADYPNPENFLSSFFSQNIPNLDHSSLGLNYSKYQNPIFDELVNNAYQENNVTKKFNLFSKAEIELMKNPPLIPLWYTGDLQIIHSYVRNFEFNSMSMFNFKNVYLKEWTAEEYQKEVTKKN